MKSLKNLIYLCSGFLQYFSSRRNSEKSYHAYVKLHSITNGFSTYSFNIIYRIIDNLNFNKKKPFKNDKFIFNRENHFNLNDKADEIIKKINSDSYCELDSKISDERCDKIVKYISSIKGYANKNENKPVNINDRNNDVSYINFHEKDLIKCDEIQKLIVNNLFLNTCRLYFKTEPILTNIGIAVSYPTDKPMTEYAQLYHFDLDRLKWLKFFVYLSDVEINDGPHCYIKGSHKLFSKPYSLMKKGYKRISDEELFNHIDKKNEKIITGKKGKIFVGDSSAFHKAMNSTNNVRIMLQLEYANSLFGSKVDEVRVNSIDNLEIRSEEFKNLKLFSRFN